jgi:hypothetical protein
MEKNERNQGMDQGSEAEDFLISDFLSKVGIIQKIVRIS